MNGTNVNYASLVSLNNAGAESDYGYLNAPLIQDPSSFAIAQTGEQQDLGFLEEAYDPAWPEPKKRRWEEYNFGGVSTTPSAAAQRTLGDMQAERTAAAQAADPMRQTELASKKAEAAATQLGLQEAYRQELEYQRGLATLNSLEATSSAKRAARLQIEGLSASIGKRIAPGGTSQAAMQEAKNAVGYIGSKEYFNPMADFTPRIDTMRRGSEERMGLIRQQMEAAGVPIPEMTPAPSAPNPAQMVVEKYGVKAPDGSPVMVGGSPVVSFKRGGRDVMMRQTPSGGFVELTAEEAAALRGQ